MEWGLAENEVGYQKIGVVVAHDAERQPRRLGRKTDDDMEENDGMARPEPQSSCDITREHHEEEYRIKDEEHESGACFSVETHSRR